VPAAGEPAAVLGEVETVRRELGHLLARFRHGAGLSQRQLARTLGYSAAVVALAEKGRPAAAEGFWVSADQTLGAVGELSTGYQKLRDMQQAARESQRNRDVAARLERIDHRTADPLRGTADPLRGTADPLRGTADPLRGTAAGFQQLATATAIGTCPNCRQPVRLVTLLTAPGETDSGGPVSEPR
jgi:transcriptional regulator with XRE-family HTH domain